MSPATAIEEGMESALSQLAGDLAPARLASVTSGARLGALSTAVVRLLSIHYGRGPTKAVSVRLNDTYVVTVLEDCLTPAEQTLVDKGYRALVHELRLAFQQAMAADFSGAAEQALGRKIVAHRSHVIPESRIGFEIFELERS